MITKKKMRRSIKSRVWEMKRKERGAVEPELRSSDNHVAQIGPLLKALGTPDALSVSSRTLRKAVNPRPMMTVFRRNIVILMEAVNVFVHSSC